MDFWQAITSGFSKYVTFSGRAIRSEYWYWILFMVLGAITTITLDLALFPDSTPEPLNSIFNLLTFLPYLAVGVRRLHDVNRSGWWILIVFTIVGIFLLIYWACKRGTLGPNRFGADPLASESLVPRST